MSGPTDFGPLVFKIADATEVEAALDLRRAIYTAEMPNPGIDLYDRIAWHLIAKRNGRIVAASRMVGPNVRPLEIESYLDLSPFVKPGRLPAQVGGFVVLKSERVVTKNSMAALGMLKLAHILAAKIGVTDFVTYVYPSLRRFYRGGLFTDPDVSFEHPLWGSVYFLHSDLVEVRKRPDSPSARAARFILGPITDSFQL